jgi:CO/xanthine dehydrogenase Mo-binding subunit
MTPFAMYDLSDVTIWGYDVVSNRPKVAAYRAPGAPVSTFATESAVDELAKQLGMDPLELRLINAAKDGTKAVYGPTLKDIGFVETLEAAKSSPHWNSPLGEAAPGKRRGRGIASGFWFNIGGESSGATYVNEDGTITVVSGNPDIGGSRASMGMMAAEVLGMDVKDVRTVVGDTTSVGFSFLTGGSRVTFATGMAVTQSAEMVRDELCKRAALLWEIPSEAVEWKDGKAYPAGENAGKFDPLSVADIAAKSARTGGPITGKASINAQGAGPGYATHICDLEVDEETGHTTVLRYTAIQDVGKAIHPSYVEGQLQGGAVQGIGWALNEEYVYTKDGRLDNAGFLDYRIPVASDLPMIETILVEVPNPRHPFGVKGVGEPPIVPPMAAVANAMENATGVRMGSLPMSPPRVRAALDAAKG